MLKTIVSKLSRIQLKNPGALAINLYKQLGPRKKVDLIKLASGIQKSKTSRYQHVIIGMFRAEISSNFLDLYLYQVLRDAGVDVKVLLCDGSTFPCDSIDSETNIFNYRCMDCKATQQQFGEIIRAEHIIRPKKTHSAPGKVENINVISSARRFDKIEHGYDENLAKRYQQTYDSIKALLEGRDMDLLIMSHGMYATWGAMRDYCQENGVDYITWGRTYFENMLSVVKNCTINEGVNAEYADLDIAHPEELKLLLKSVDSRIANYRSVDYYAYLKSENPSPSNILDRIKAHSGKSVATYLGIPWDGTVYGSNGDFKGQRDLIRSIVESAAAHPEIVYVFRVHPKESETTEKASEQIQELCGGRLPNVLVLDARSPVTSYELMKVVGLNIVYSGTLALEIARAGFPLVVCGKNLTSNFPGIKTISTSAQLESVWLSDFSDYRSQGVDMLFNKIAKTFYIDDLSNTEVYDVTSLNKCSTLVDRILQDLVFV